MGTPRRVVYARRRRRRVKAADNDLTSAQWEAVLKVWESCAYCSATLDSLQKDCVIPIAWGGSYTLDNVVPACRSCNASKCNQEVTVWMKRKRLDGTRFFERWVAAKAALLTAQEREPRE